MNNGSRDTSASDIQKLQQQLQDMKEQVGFSYINIFPFQGAVLNFGIKHFVEMKNK